MAKQRHHNPQQAKFFFEGTEIPLDINCAIFITMNPGYQGRTELPDNLKALFRPVAMMIPNYAMITEISLYSCGFVNSRDLSIKITNSLKLASEQLSTQSHYDFGMRAVKAIIQAAGNLKRQEPKENEYLLALRAIRDCNIPKFTSKDVPLFTAIITDLFPGVKENEVNYGELDKGIQKAMKEKSLSMSNRVHQKIVELYDTIQVRHGLMLVGQANSGKTTVMDVLASAIGEKNKIIEEQKKKNQEEQNQIKEINEGKSSSSDDDDEEEESDTKEKDKKNVNNKGATNERGQEKQMSITDFLQDSHQPKKVEPQLISDKILNPNERRKSMAVQFAEQQLMKLVSLPSLKVDQQKEVTYSIVMKNILNPKSITTKILFGECDEAGEWHDGISAKIFRECFEDRSNNLQWVVFDGPVDALWIENMNTVLDDNKKLCLTNGETIKLTQLMSIIFEVEDLLEASPATVSRCGMVYLEIQDLAWQSLIKPWYKTIAEVISTKFYREYYQALFDAILQPVVDFVFSSQNNFVVNQVTANWLIQSFLKMFESFMYGNKTKAEVIEADEIELEKEYQKIDAAKLEGKDISDMQPTRDKPLSEKQRIQLFGNFVMALVWSFGALLDEKSRKVFDIFLRNTLKSEVIDKEVIKGVNEKMLPSNDQPGFFDTFFDVDKRIWDLWLGNQKYQIPKGIQFHEIFVPTSDSVRHNTILKYLAIHNFSCLFYGKTGTAKTLISKKFVLQDLDSSKYRATLTSFSATTNCSQVQDVLESKIEKQKRRKGVYGPLLGTTNIIFVDDLNMPNKERYGAQPPLELIRQWFSQGGWYDRKTLEFNQIIDISIIGAMGLGRPALSHRLMRYFNIIYLNDMDDNNLSYILTKILDWGFTDYIDKLKIFIKKVVVVCISLHKLISKEFRPLPKKSHYIYNLRDLMKMAQGLMTVPPSQYSANSDCKSQLLKLWVHEASCVYGDRLINDEDKNKFLQNLNQVLKEVVGESLKDIVTANTSQFNSSMNSAINSPNSNPTQFDFKQQQNIDEGQSQQQSDQQQLNVELSSGMGSMIFGNFIESNGYVYHEMKNLELVKQAIQDQIAKYNQIHKKQINIIIFEDAVRMLCKVNRILLQPFGNALLIGLGGAGMRTLVKIASFIESIEVYEIEMEKDFGNSEWLEYIREMMKDIVLKNRQVTFLLSETTIVNEKFLEDVNNLLNTGEIPNLFFGEEKENLLTDVKEMAEKMYKVSLSGMQIWEFFVKQCKSNMHIVLSLSSIGDKLRQRIRNFPSLISCTSIIWVSQWSDSALKEVAYHYLEQDIQDQDEQQRQIQIQKISDICQNFHNSVTNKVEDYFRQTRQHVYITPMSYLQLLKNFKQMYLNKQKELLNQKQTYERGVQKLNDCGQMVDEMKKQLEELQPQLINQTKETEEIMKNLEVENEEVKKQKAIVEVDEIETSKKAENAAGIQAQCKDKLSVAEPGLQEALDALQTLEKSKFIEMKSYQKPPILIKMTMDAVCILLCQKGKKNEKGQIDYWEDARKLLNEPANLLKRLEKYDKENMTETTVNKMKQFLEKYPNFTPEKIANASNAAEGLCKWSLKIYDYYFVYKSILPLREALAEANMKLDAANAELKKKRDLLEAIEDKCRKLKEKFDQQNAEKMRLSSLISDCTVKLERSQLLISKLSDEKGRWEQASARLQNDLKNLQGDILLAVGYISYLGAFTGEFRKEIIVNWKQFVGAQQIGFSADFSLINKIGVPTQIFEWTNNGLPLDEVSKENAIIMDKADNWPLIIDPQKQAARFIKKMETRVSEQHFLVLKPGKEVEKMIEFAIKTGKTVMVEGCQEQLDPVLDSMLPKNSRMTVVGGQKMINLSIGTIEYNDKFKLYMLTNLPSPHFTPEVLTKVVLLNFSITHEAAKDQLLSLLIKEEDEALYKDSEGIQIQNQMNQQKIAEVERSILELLSNTDGKQMLEDNSMIDTLNKSKEIAEEASKQLKEAQVTQSRINNIKEQLDPVVEYSSRLYFAILSFSRLDPMYQFSMGFFEAVYKQSIKNAEKTSKSKNDQKNKIRNLIESLKKHVYVKMNRSLFVKHKLLFSFIMTITYLRVTENFSEDDYNLMISGISGKDIQQIDNPDTKTFTVSQWNAILHLNNLPNFSGIVNDILDQLKVYQEFMVKLKDYQKTPFNLFEISFPEQFQCLSNFSKLVLLKSLFPEQFLEKLKQFIQEENKLQSFKSDFKLSSGQFFAENISMSLEETLNESDAHIPLIFLLSPGDDPLDDLKKFVSEKKGHMAQVSLGKGQGAYAEAQIREQMAYGTWCLLQNCHLAISWLPRLVEIIEEIQIINTRKMAGNPDKDRKFSPDFRLLLTSMSSDKFPIEILQQGIKITKDPPKGVRANMIQIYENQSATTQEKDFYNGCQKDAFWKKLYMSLSFFHSIVRERRRFGPIGWNIYYDFNYADFKISMKQLRTMLDEQQEIPFKALIYLTGECYYGGKVTDDWDRRLLMTLLNNFYNTEAVFNSTYKFSSVESYFIPDLDVFTDLPSTQRFLKETLPEVNDPDLFGLNQNALISSSIIECNFLVQCMQSMKGGNLTSKSDNLNKVIEDRARKFQKELPQDFDITSVSSKYPVNYSESMNIVLIQELLRYNNLLGIIRNSLQNLLNGLAGLQIMTSELDNLGESLDNNMIPRMWAEKSYPSLKSLSGYQEDLIKRINFFNEWIEKGIPSIFWIPGFYFTQSFLTGLKQNYARKKTIPIDKIDFTFQIRDEILLSKNVRTITTPTEGCLVHGLYIEGAKWLADKHIIEESDPNIVYGIMPVIQFMPIVDKKEASEQTYICPMYKTTERKGVLSTTGHSTNFIMQVELPTKQLSSHWIKRGTALLTQLND